MKAGKLRKRIEVHGYTEAQDSYGEPIRTWAKVTDGDRWAQIEPLTGRELLQAQQIGGEVTHRVRMRYFASVTTKTKLKVGTRYLEVVSVLNPNELGAEMELLCKEAV